MNSVNRQSAALSPVGDILLAVPEFQGLHISTRNEVANFIERKLKKFDLKLGASPYTQNRPADPLGVNSDFGNGLRNWLHQFPPEHRLGLLAAVFSTIYITEDEIDSFIEIGIARLREKVVESAELDRQLSGAGPADWSLVQHDIRCYPISEYGAYEKVIRKLPIAGSRDRSIRPVRGLVEELVKETFRDLRMIADRHQQSSIYWEEAGYRVAELIRSLRNGHVVLVEDGTFSGKRIRREAGHFLRLMRVLFAGFENEMSVNGYRQPWVYLLVVYGTADALESMQGLGQMNEAGHTYNRFVPVFGYVFDRDASVNPGPSAATKELAALTQKANPAKKLKQAVQYFHEKYSHRYWDSETEIRKMLKLPDQDLPYGLGGRGWTLLTHVNCPNDSLPLLWYPHVGSVADIRALFPRLESQSEGESMHELKESIDIASGDKDRCLHDFLLQVHREP